MKNRLHVSTRFLKKLLNLAKINAWLLSIMSVISSRTKSIFEALSTNDELNHVYSEKEIGSMPISIISSDNIYNPNNSEHICDATLAHEEIIEIEQTILLSSNDSNPYDSGRNDTFIDIDIYYNIYYCTIFRVYILLKKYIVRKNTIFQLKEYFVRLYRPDRTD